jgi:hypothetical protein
MMRKFAAIISTVALILGLFAAASFGGGKPPADDPVCEVICVPFPPPIYTHCMIYCPPLYE